MNSLEYLDYIELACIICGLDYDNIVDNNDWLTLDDALSDKFDIPGMESFAKIASTLIKFTPVVLTAITETPVQGFSICEDKKKDIWRFIVKEEYKG